jgi:flagellin-like protein
MVFNNKKAISPLVATILLVAFAVSIGALIMNWTSSTSGISLPASCSSVDLELLSSCTSDTEIVISLQNNAPADISSVLLKDNSGSMINYRIPGSMIASSESKVFKIQKQEFDSVDFEIIPIVISGIDELVCTSKKIESIFLVSC